MCVVNSPAASWLSDLQLSAPPVFRRLKSESSPAPTFRSGPSCPPTFRKPEAAIPAPPTFRKPASGDGPSSVYVPVPISAPGPPSFRRPSPHDHSSAFGTPYKQISAFGQTSGSLQPSISSKPSVIPSGEVRTLPITFDDSVCK